MNYKYMYVHGFVGMFRDKKNPETILVEMMHCLSCFLLHRVSHENLFYVILHTHITEEELEFYMNAATSADTHGPLRSRVTTGDQVDSDLATPTATPTGQRMRRRDKGVFTSTRKRKFEGTYD